MEHKYEEEEEEEVDDDAKIAPNVPRSCWYIDKIYIYILKTAIWGASIIIISQMITESVKWSLMNDWWRSPIHPVSEDTVQRAPGYTYQCLNSHVPLSLRLTGAWHWEQLDHGRCLDKIRHTSSLVLCCLRGTTTASDIDWVGLGQRHH